MLAVGLQVLYSSVWSLIQGETESPDVLAAIIGVVSAILMYGVYTFNRRLAAQVKVPHCLLLPKTIAAMLGPASEPPLPFLPLLLAGGGLIV